MFGVHYHPENPNDRLKIHFDTLSELNTAYETVAKHIRAQQ